MLKAIRDEIIVRVNYVEKKSLIYIPETAVKHKQYDDEVSGVVVSVGQDAQACKDDVQVDSIVVWRRHEGKKIMYKGVEYRSIREKWLLYVEN